MISISFLQLVFLVLATTIKLAKSGRMGEPELDIAVGNNQGGRRRAFLDGYFGNDDDLIFQDAVGPIFGSLVVGISRNPSWQDRLSEIALYGISVAQAGDDIEDIGSIFEAYNASFTNNVILRTPLPSYGYNIQDLKVAEGSNIALGSIFGALGLGVARNPSLQEFMFSVAIFGASVSRSGDRIEDLNKHFSVLNESVANTIGLE